MKRVAALLLVLCVLLSACGKADPYDKFMDQGHKLLRNGDYTEAIKIFQEAIDTDPQRPEGYKFRGDAYRKAAEEALEEGRREDAEDYLENAGEDYDRAEKWDYDDPDALDESRKELEILTERIEDHDVGPGGRPEDADTAESRKEIYREYFYTRFDDSDHVVLADVTGDGCEEMLVVDPDGFEINGYVFTVASEEVKEIYTNSGSSVHAGGFYGWYLVERDGGYCLGEEGFGMWQGVGILSFTQYTLDENGNKTVVEELILNSEDAGSHDEYGMVTEEAYFAYTDQLYAIMEHSYCLYASASECGYSRPIETYPPAVFGTTGSDTSDVAMETVGVEDFFVELYENPYGGFTYCCHIPQFVTGDDRCMIMNEQIYQDLSRIMNEHYWQFDADAGQCGASICYSKGQNNGIASLVAQVTVQSSDYWYFRTYNMNVATGWEATDQEVMEAFGLTENEFHQQLAQVLMPWFEENFGELRQYISEDEYIQLYVMTTCEENLRMARPCIDEQGRLCAIVEIYTYAGAGNYQYRICLEGDPEGSGHWIQCQVHG